MGWKEFFKPTKFKLIISIILFFIIAPWPIYLIMYSLTWTFFLNRSIDLFQGIFILFALILLFLIPYLISCALYPLWIKIISFCNTNRRRIFLKLIFATILLSIFFISLLFNPYLTGTIYNLQKSDEADFEQCNRFQNEVNKDECISQVSHNYYDLSYDEFQSKFKAIYQFF